MTAHNPNLAAIAHDDPEIVAQVRSEAHAELARGIVNREPDFYLKAGQELEAHLSESQLAALVDFYHTPTGRKVAQFGPTINHGDGKDQDDTYDIWHPDAPPLTPADVSNFAEFGKTDASIELKKEGAVLKKLMFQWMNDVLDSEFPKIKHDMEISLNYKYELKHHWR